MFPHPPSEMFPHVMDPGIANDVQSIGRIDAVPRMLQAFMLRMPLAPAPAS